ncbi:FAD/NAD(P)-binding protein [Streptomyces sp. NBC_01016]|uniref:FAD/NAD(P)-binding protein n=1 Tax=Streptomyces sp. NBC_01016 TaxID=2903720 RepID=UPI002259A45F|nr:FAD/NAD(P)-binding protein [Streptomyces sp. NBC_01016]MCX4832483.1 FAD/NAD(P)-binding protein [Streptomyces sp. NBC_01016]
MTGERLEICVVGAGPRGLSVLERLCANARDRRPAGPIVVHVVDPDRPGAGRVWRTDQSRHLLMNTVASRVTVFTDAGTPVEGPEEPGPSLYEWARFRTVMGPFDDTQDDMESGAEGWSDADWANADGAVSDGADGAALAEMRDLGPDSYPSRALYGRYLEWAFGRVVRRAPERLTVRVHRSRAVAVDDAAEPPYQEVLLDDGTLLDRLDAVVLSQGHVPARLSRAEEELALGAIDHGLVYVPPANPADLALDRLVAPGEPVLLRGLGLNFFDHMALFTEGRGGTYERTADGLVYRPSGREPLICAGSRRGVPHRAHGRNEKGAHGHHVPRLLTPERIERLRGGDRLDFRADLWPLIAKEVETVYYETLLAGRVHRAEAGAFAARFATAPRGDEDRLLTEAGVRDAERWNWDLVHRPYGARDFSSHEDFTHWLVDHLRADARAARLGNVSGPLKAALDVLRDLRDTIRLAVDHGGLDGRSHRDDLDRWYTPLSAFLSDGPSAHRVEQLTALIEAGVLRVAGPGTRVTATPEGFALESDVPGVRLTGRVLFEARLPAPDLRRTADPLLRHLLSAGHCRPFRVRSADGTSYETGGLDVTDRPHHVVDATGRPHPRRFAHGVPTESVHWATATGVGPGVDSVTLRDGDALARAVLDAAPGFAGAPA